MRRPAGVPARVVVTDLNGVVTTWLSGKSLLGATVTSNLDLPSQITVDVRSGDKSVNTIFPADGDPLVAQSNRLAYVFLNEAPTAEMVDTRWVCRAAGILMSPDDQADADISTTHFTAYDPWQFFMGLPCFADELGTLIPQIGLTFPASAGNDIAYTLIQNTYASLLALGLAGPGFFADIPPAYGGTSFWSGTNEVTPTLDFVVQQGTSLGQALQNLASTGNDVQGTSQCIDIVFEPIYDPGSGISPRRPGYTSQISIFNLAGIERPGAPMGWGRFNRSAMTADRQHDGTPGAFVNVAQFVAGQGGDLALVTPLDAAASVAKYGSYWLQKFFPGQPFASVVNNLAVQALTLQKQGKRTFLVDPDPLRAGMPFRDYAIGDRIPVYSTKAQRVPEAGLERVQTIPLVIGADGVTSVSKLLVSPDWPGDTNT